MPTQIAGLSTEEHDWFVNLAKSALFIYIQLMTAPFMSFFGILGYPNTQFQFTSGLDLFPPACDQWNQLTNVKMISENYHVSYDSNTRFIYLDPKINHKSTVIFLHEFSKFNFDYFKDFSDGLAAPLTSRIVLP